MDRNGFARDKDRILFTRAFRRLQHKTQMFPYEKGDHFRTRLTHTMEVSQIARSLARYLSVDEDLAEAIALGHDIGHTPFGHQGEEVLDGIMSGNDNLGKDIEIQLNHGGFKHNYNSIKILDVTQLKYEDISGLNLSWQVLEGILKHTKINRHPKDECEECGKCWDIERFVNNKELIERLYLIKGNGSSERRLEDIRFKDGDRTEIDSLVSILKLENSDENIVDQEGFLNHLVDNKLISELKIINDNNSEKLTPDREKFLKCLSENNYAFLSTICDYIAGMTDNYAKKEFKDLY
jgi:putative nucleotidyltransferase with HDIG domain